MTGQYQPPGVLSVLLSAEGIQQRVAALGEKISFDYRREVQEGKELVVLAVLKGAFPFCADLIRCLHLPLQVDFIKASSYGSSTKSSGRVELTVDTKLDLKDRHVLLVEDIVDTGLTITFLKEHLRLRGAKSIRLATFLHKSEATEYPVEIDYLGFTIKNEFVVGYGLDYAEKYRQLPYVGIFACER